RRRVRPERLHGARRAAAALGAVLGTQLLGVAAFRPASVWGGVGLDLAAGAVAALLVFADWRPPAGAPRAAA
ncbi:hypothetical protein, partial [Roseisolibacter sp. H3M3-2]|uniref:hypothetical protein n=1 Tax=Roseisolibacter sp. H3M3-2 TaxID=3031323 RepID=UPI0023D9E351